MGGEPERAEGLEGDGEQGLSTGCAGHLVALLHAGSKIAKMEGSTLPTASPLREREWRGPVQEATAAKPIPAAGPGWGKGPSCDDQIPKDGACRWNSAPRNVNQPSVSHVTVSGSLRNVGAQLPYLCSLLAQEGQIRLKMVVSYLGCRLRWREVGLDPVPREVPIPGALASHLQTDSQTWEQDLLLPLHLVAPKGPSPQEDAAVGTPHRTTVAGTGTQERGLSQSV